MYVAMNRFRVRPERAGAFEEMWLNREVHLHKEPGFLAFHMLKSPDTEGEGEEAHRLYVSHTVWASEDDFHAWTRSPSFRAAHGQAGRKPADAEPMTLGAPRFEGFNAIQSVRSDGAVAHDPARVADGVRIEAAPAPAP